MDVLKDNSRHVCVLCKRKKVAYRMIKHGSHWTCLSCVNQPAAAAAEDNAREIKILNLYAGIGGNRKLWTGGRVTAVEKDPKIAAAYYELYPHDLIIIGDAHKYLLANYFKYDIIWSSPPCQSHSRMNFWTAGTKKRYADLSLYEEILLLKSFFRGKWVVENVSPYYTPLVKEDKKIGRHLFWSNVVISDCEVPQLPGFISLDTCNDKKKIMDYLGIYTDRKLYSSSKKPIQVFRNCVHPLIGGSIFNDILASMK